MNDLDSYRKLALDHRRPKQALRLLDQHAHDYPNSHLADTREVSRVLALHELGSTSDGCRAKQRFLARWPESPYRHRIEKLCTK